MIYGGSASTALQMYFLDTNIGQITTTFDGAINQPFMVIANSANFSITETILSGNDHLDGGAGNDLIYGQDGNDNPDRRCRN